MPDWTAAPYGRVFTTLRDDQPIVWADDRLLAWYVRLLVPADRAWPVALTWPRSIPQDVADQLVLVNAIDALEGDRYQVHGMARLQERVARRNRAGGLVRASTAGRDDQGRWTSDAGTSVAGDAGEPPANGQQRWTSTAGVQRSSDGTYTESPGDPLPLVGDHQETNPEETARATEDPVAAVEVLYRANVRDHGPDNAACDNPALHRLVHTWSEEGGWACTTCVRWGGPRHQAALERFDHERPF